MNGPYDFPEEIIRQYTKVKLTDIQNGRICIGYTNYQRGWGGYIMVYCFVDEQSPEVQRIMTAQVNYPIRYVIVAAPPDDVMPIADEQ